jgi:hypothetical protein
MTRQESFKRRIRERMARTGERYGAARRVLLERTGAGTPADGWVADPGQTEEAVRTATGRGWDEWCRLIDVDPGREAGHTAIAAHLTGRHGVDAWWAQAVTVGYERIRGLRAKHQMADGTFTAARSRTLPVDGADLRELLLWRTDDLFPDVPVERRSRDTAKRIRLRMESGIAEITLEALPDGRTRVSVAHTGLPIGDAADAWRAWWGEWLDALAG